MNDAAGSAVADAPVWAREDAFPEAPPGWGWVNDKREGHACASEKELIDAICADREARIVLVWTPAEPRMVLPEEVPSLFEAIVTVRKRWSAEDCEAGDRRLRWFGLFVLLLAAFAFAQGWRAAQQAGLPGGASWSLALQAVLRSSSLGIVLLLFVIFAFFPWYQARKRRKELASWGSPQRMAEVVPAIRFETWLAWQPAPVTRAFLLLMTGVGLAQCLPGNGILSAGLVRERYLQGEWWRLFTAPFVHGNLVHFLMNAAALLYLGKRLEVFARWPHLPLVFLFSALAGGIASVRWMQGVGVSVGASGGLMGWLGFLLAFETLHHRLVPRTARKRLLAGVVMTAFIGAVGYRFIDNAAHLGGLLAGMAYAAIVFPKSDSALRPSIRGSDRMAGGAALIACAAIALFAVWRMLA